MNGRYILNDAHEAVPCPDLMEWGRWLEIADNRRVADSRKRMDDGSIVRVSTVFLGLDHSFGHEQEPVLFETMIFGGEKDGERWRYATWGAAEVGHRAACELAGVEP